MALQAPLIYIIIMTQRSQSVPETWISLPSTEKRGIVIALIYILRSLMLPLGSIRNAPFYLLLI
jgi:hypothetical protein